MEAAWGRRGGGVDAAWRRREGCVLAECSGVQEQYGRVWGLHLN